jgi:hypothetical protein
VLNSFIGFLRRCGFENLSVRPHKSIYIVGTTGRSAEKIISLLYKDAGIALLRKSQIALKIPERQSQSPATAPVGAATHVGGVGKHTG